MRRTTAAFVSLALTALLAGVATPAGACTMNNPVLACQQLPAVLNPPTAATAPGPTNPRPKGLVAGGLITMSARNMGDCFCGFRYDPDVVRVRGAEMLDSMGKKLMQCIDFQPSDEVTAALERIAPSPGFAWSGFFGRPDPQFPGGVPVEIWIILEMLPGKTDADFADMMARGGLFIDGSANSLGEPNFLHMSAVGNNAMHPYFHTPATSGTDKE